MRAEKSIMLSWMCGGAMSCIITQVEMNMVVGGRWTTWIADSVEYQQQELQTPDVGCLRGKSVAFRAHTIIA